MAPNTICQTEDARSRYRSLESEPKPSLHEAVWRQLEPVTLGCAASLLRNPLLGERANGTIHAQTMQGVQRTHGNCAVQRALNTVGPTRHIAVQRDPVDWFPEFEEGDQQRATDALYGSEEATSQDEDARAARKGRTIASAATRTARAANEAIVVGPQAAREAKALTGINEVIDEGNWGKLDAASDAYGEASVAKQAAESKAKANFLNKGPNKTSFGGKAMDKITGSTNYIGQGLGLANYGLQFWENMARGHDTGEAIFGALGGGWANGQMTKQLFSGKPTFRLTPRGQPLKSGGGWVDTGVNVLNAGLQLAGAPEEVTTVTQTVADATPTSFATSLASNAGRGLYNLVTGDLEGLKQQGKDLTHGKSGAPLQGYAVAGEAAYALLSGDDEMLDRIREENASGKRGKLAQFGSWIGRGLREWTDSLFEYDETDAFFDGGPEAVERFRKMHATRELREEAVRRDRLKRQEEERKREAQFQLEMEQSMKIMRGEAQPYEPMLQTQMPVRYDEEGNPVLPTRMALEPRRRGR